MSAKLSTQASSCDKAPAGWRCTRLKGHAGPCAAKHDAVRKLTQHCVLCGAIGVSYVKTKGGFHKVCDSCWDVLDAESLTVPCAIVRAV